MPMNQKKFFCFILLSLTFISGWCETSDSTKMGNDDIRFEAIKNDFHKIATGYDSQQRDSMERLINRFYMDQFQHFQDPRSPYFMFMSKTGNLAFGVGGQVKIKGYYDWNGSIPSSGFTPYSIPIPKNPATMRNLAASASGTGLFFTLLGHNSLLGDFMAYFQADFAGYKDRGFRIKKAYFTFRDWTVGYAVTTFEDTKAEPATVDGSGPNGVNSRKNVLVRYLTPFKKNWTFAASFEFPSQSIMADSKDTEECNAYLPDLAAFLQYQWDNNHSHVRLSGLLRTLMYRDLISQQNRKVTGWALQLSSVIRIIPNFNFFGIVSTGEGHASYTADLGNGDFDLIPDTQNPGKLYAPLSAGYVAGLQYFFRPDLFSNLVFSEQKYFPKRNPNDTQYEYGLYGAANLFWDITPRLELGLEYLHGKRKNFDGSYGSADRIMAMLMLSF